MEAGIEVFDSMASLRERMDVPGGCEVREISSGGLRNDFKVTFSERSCPGASFCLLGRGRGIFGSMYC